MEKPRPAFIKHWSEIQDPDNSFYPRNPEMIGGREDWWHDWPQQEMGKHDGLPDKLRESKS